MSTAEAAVALRGVRKTFPAAGAADPVVVLDGVDLSLARGEKASLVGPSGSGKSTLLSLVAGLLRPDIGTIQVDGVDLGSLDEAGRARVRAARVGIALQSEALIGFLTARENVEVALSYGVAGRRERPSRRDRRARALELLDRFDVAHRADHKPRHLSGGEAQRVGLAVAVANDPVLLLADEAVAALDGATAGRIAEEVFAAPFALLFVTHDPALADQVERRLALADHRVVER